MFPITWIFSWHALGYISEQNYFIIHGLLDIVCKGVYGIVICYYRMVVEDYFIDTGIYDKQHKQTMSFQVRKFGTLTGEKDQRYPDQSALQATTDDLDTNTHHIDIADADNLVQKIE